MLKINKGGLQTTVQDSGRYGLQKFGVITNGAMDPYAFRIANILIGNTEFEAALEITLAGPVIEFEQDAMIALCGGDLSPVIDGQNAKMWRPLFVPKGSTLTFGAPRTGTRAYLAVAGGIDVPEIMGSKSTYLRAGIGGFKGRALEAGDELTAGRLSSRQSALLAAHSKNNVCQPSWSVASLSYSAEPVIQVMEGRQFSLFDSRSRDHFFQETFSISVQSDRMGCRLEGVSLHLEETQELISEAVAFGSVQVPPDGNPIVLLADRQTTGGYPKIGQIASVDLPLVAQLKPGDRLHFQKISLEEAQQLYRAQEQLIRQLKTSIRLKQEEWI
ncbi:5-oxoprolinase subunit C family protein [Planococcus lenghuensis]|uniref:KipI antagonist n=1 Tax=Planococcus lenghuensis TaxID=2213202 RepID=A0A1Q2L3R7_9BACL|nr:biotin-dependent carboxyltransferase family protein [Planococcus lenghuensis]AQQ54522.1 KipI antagonist [Planococcus lenghuensis]